MVVLIYVAAVEDLVEVVEVLVLLEVKVEVVLEDFYLVQLLYLKVLVIQLQ